MLFSRPQASVNLLPAFEAIQLCYRFGTEDAAITTLPEELLGVVQERLLCEERVRLLEEVTKANLCFGSKCDWEDHPTKDEVETL